MRLKLFATVLLILFAAFLVHAQPVPKHAVATLAATHGNTATGTVTFSSKKNVVHITGRVTGLKPGLHGFHIHEKGDCSAPDAASAGGHFNPDGKSHGGPTSPEHHVGDLGNILANAKGIARIHLSVDYLTLGPGPDSIIGKAVIVHQGTDDFKTQPSGNSGARVACGVVEAK